MQAKWEAVDDLIEERLVGRDRALDGALASNAAAGLPAIDVSPAQGKFLHLLARMLRARRILEIGALGGYSTIWLAKALPADGHLVSLERESHHAAVARANLARAGLADRVSIRVGSALETLPKLAEELAAESAGEGGGSFDLVFIDADKLNNGRYFAWALEMTRPGAAIVVDNVVRHGEIADPTSQDESAQAVRRFLDDVSREPRVDATALQTVGAKGWDGFLLALVVRVAAAGA